MSELVSLLLHHGDLNAAEHVQLHKRVAWLELDRGFVWVRAFEMFEVGELLRSAFLRSVREPLCRPLLAYYAANDTIPMAPSVRASCSHTYHWRCYRRAYTRAAVECVVLWM